MLLCFNYNLQTSATLATNSIVSRIPETTSELVSNFYFCVCESEKFTAVATVPPFVLNLILKRLLLLLSWWSTLAGNFLRLILKI
jgi:hypothetical protein